MFVTILKKYVWVFNLILLAALAYLLAINVNAKIKGEVNSYNADTTQSFFPADNNKRKTKKNIPLSSYEIIVKRNIFGVSDPSGSPEVVSANPESLPESNLNLILLATKINADEDSVAVIKNNDNSKVGGYKSGEEISIITSEKVKLLDVKHCKAVIQRRTKGQETIKCKNLGDIASTGSKLVPPPNTRASARRNGKSKNSPKQITKLSDNEYEVERALLEDLLSDPTQIVQQARVIPQDNGLRFFGIRSNSIFWKIGIKNGDTLHRINNVELNDIERALGIFEELRHQSSFTIDLTRAGQKYTYEYSVK